LAGLRPEREGDGCSHSNTPAVAGRSGIRSPLRHVNRVRSLRPQQPAAVVSVAAVVAAAPVVAAAAA
jgi:hypothetical protein